MAKPNIHDKKLMLCIWWDQLGVIYYELLQPNETITGEPLKIKRPLYAKRHDKVIYQHDNARPHVAKVVKETLEAPKWDVLPHLPYSPDIAPSDYHMFRSMTHGLAEQHFTSYEEAKNWVMFGSPQKTRNFFDTESLCCLKDGKKSHKKEKGLLVVHTICCVNSRQSPVPLAEKNADRKREKGKGGLRDVVSGAITNGFCYLGYEKSAAEGEQRIITNLWRPHFASANWDKASKHIRAEAWRPHYASASTRWENTSLRMRGHHPELSSDWLLPTLDLALTR
ncbi:hypothetical protein LAZ67_X001233 [Cordylochernes scorpioides]|uniref:Transposase n=1 Tax=Cordylochernes scorpioides TaxID=51811 RepID=A0ABY6LX61_9ARAC|nr:hypothetical protein LAZ67_X001233 [Cordylochernes scorpioides]